MDLFFRNAGKGDLLELIQMLADDELGTQREDASLPLNSMYLETFDSIRSDPNNELIVACQGQNLVGMLQLTFIPYLTYRGSWRCLVEGVRIHSGYRGLGFGQKLIEWAIARARDKSCHMVQLTSDKTRQDTLRFYKSLGFVASHEGFKLPLK